MPTARITQRISRSPERPDPMSDEALAEIGRVILAIEIERVSSASYIEPAADSSGA